MNLRETQPSQVALQITRQRGTGKVESKMAGLKVGFIFFNIFIF